MIYHVMTLFIMLAIVYYTNYDHHNELMPKITLK